MQDGTGLPPPRGWHIRPTPLLPLQEHITAPAAPGTYPNHCPISFNSCLSSGSRAFYLLPNTPLTELFKYKFPREGRPIRCKNYKKTVPQPGYLVA